MQELDDSRKQKTTFKSQIYRAFSALSPVEKKHVVKLVGAQSVLSLIDLVSILLIGVFVASSLSVDGQAGYFANFANMISGILGTNSNGVVALVMIAILLLLLKTVLSILITRKTLKFFSMQASKLSSDLVEFSFSKDVEDIHKKSLQEVIFTTTRGVEVLTLQVMATIAIMISDVFLLLILTMGLFLIDIPMAIVTILMFGSITITLNLLMGKRSTRLGEISTMKSIASSQSIEKLYYSFRELFVKNRIRYETKKIGLIRENLSQTLAEVNFLPYIGKYVIETSLVLGGAITALVVFSHRDLPSALTVMAMFLASGSRIAPSILRLQQSYVTVRSYFGMTDSTLSLIEELQEKVELENMREQIPSIIETSDIFIGRISIQNLSFRYSSQESFAIDIDQLEIAPGSNVAIVGASGAGKSTLVDLILGLLSPHSGSIRISGRDPHGAIRTWPGKVAYVPQEIRIFDGTLAENIAHGYSLSGIEESELKEAISSAALSELIANSTSGINLMLGTKGVKLSGGQTQRVGIARALLTRPEIIVFDEATSALDAETESIITKTLTSLKGKTTVVTVAHRLSTVLNADTVLYLQDGCILARGTFNEVRQKVPNFDRQAKLMGLEGEISSQDRV